MNFPYKYYREITIDHTKIDSTLSHFPLPVLIGESVGVDGQDVTDIFDEVGSDYLKIVVTKDDGETQLYVEVEQWDAANERALLWVSRDNWDVDSDSDTIIRLYYDSSADDNTDYVGDPGSRTEVWDSDFGAVYNFAQDPSSDNLIDSTSHGNDAVPSDTFTSDDLVDAQIGKGWIFNSDDDDEAIAPDSDSLDLEDECTIQTTIKPYAQGTSYPRILYKAPFTDSYEVDFSGDDYKFKVDVSTIVEDSLSEDTWYIISTQYSVSADKAQLFINGTVEDDKTGINSIPVTSDELRIGRRENHYTFDGIIASIRLSLTARSSAWIKADAYAQADDLLVWGPVEYGIVYEVSGTVEEEGSSVERTVRIYKRSTGELVAETTSTYGEFMFDEIPSQDEHYVVALDDISDETDYNALIYDRIVPQEIT